MSSKNQSTITFKHATISGTDAAKRFAVMCETTNLPEILVKLGKYVVDGKSIMGIFSLDLARPVEIEATGDLADIEDFEVSLREGGFIE